MDSNAILDVTKRSKAEIRKRAVFRTGFVNMSFHRFPLIVRFRYLDVSVEDRSLRLTPIR